MFNTSAEIDFMSIPKALEMPNTLEETRAAMRIRLHGVVPDFEIDLKAETAFKINQLKKERNAVILGHNYMEPALYHSVPDYVGDSLQLASISAQTEADIILFCGVWFMGETAKVLNPEKLVLVPSKEAGCSLAEGISAADIRGLRERFPGVPVVSYVNTYAEVKKESDYCCTSGNAEKVLTHLFDKGHDHALFLPDEFLAKNTAASLGVAYVDSGDPAAVAPPGERAVIGWNTRCEVHELFTVEDVQNIRRQYPDAVILAHPECSPEVIAAVDISGSTKAMVDYVEKVDAPRYALFTECSMGDNIAAQFPHRQMVRACSLRCKHMNLITLEDTLAALENDHYPVELSEELIQGARKAIDRMIRIR
jgi:quinolinate synthase